MECVDQWIKVGRNACPACRTEGKLADSIPGCKLINSGRSED
jgi:hypothetical protein